MNFKNTISKIKKTAIGTAETVAQTAKEGSASVVQKSNNILELSRLTLSVNSKENKLKDLYTFIGKQVCDKYQEDIYIDPALVNDCNQVMKIRNDIKNIQHTIQKIKNNSNK